METDQILIFLTLGISVNWNFYVVRAFLVRDERAQKLRRLIGFKQGRFGFQIHFLIEFFRNRDLIVQRNPRLILNIEVLP